MDKKHAWSEKNFRMSRAVAVAGAVVGRNLEYPYLSRLKCYRIQILATLSHLGWIDAPHTQNFEFFKSLEKTQESKNLEFISVFFF